MAEEKLSRNSLCKCGSGRKYKNCCLRKRPKGPRYEWPDEFAPRDVHSDGASLSVPRQEPRAKSGGTYRVSVHYTFPECYGDANIHYSFPVDRVIVLEGGMLTTAVRLTVGSRFLMQHGQIATVAGVEPPKWWDGLSDRLTNGRLRADRVVGRSERIGNVVIDLSFGGQAITATPGHLFYSASRRKYVPAEQLEIGELLETTTGATVALDSKSAPRYGLLKLYNIEVEKYHNFFVGEGNGAVRVHNGVPGAAGSGIPMPAEPPGSSRSDALSQFPFSAISLAPHAELYRNSSSMGGGQATVVPLNGPEFLLNNWTLTPLYPLVAPSVEEEMGRDISGADAQAAFAIAASTLKSANLSQDEKDLRLSIIRAAVTSRFVESDLMDQFLTTGNMEDIRNKRPDKWVFKNPRNPNETDPDKMNFYVKPGQTPTDAIGQLWDANRAWPMYCAKITGFIYYKGLIDYARLKEKSSDQEVRENARKLLSRINGAIGHDNVPQEVVGQFYDQETGANLTSELQPGDWVWWNNPNGPRDNPDSGSNTIYIGKNADGKMVFLDFYAKKLLTYDEFQKKMYMMSDRTIPLENFHPNRIRRPKPADLCGGA